MNAQTSQTHHDRLGVSLPRDLIERIRADAEAAHRPISWQVALIARQYYQRQEKRFSLPRATAPLNR
jgi:hypothetical protein